MGGPKMNRRQIQNVPRILAALSVVVLVLLSGCAGKSKTTAAIGGVTSTAQVNDETGGIEGAILMDEGLPVPLADVGIPSLDITARTNEVGYYSLSFVPPGLHTVYASAIGFEPAMTQVDVRAGEVSSGTDLTMKAMASSGPFRQTLNENGFFGCGSSWRPAAVVSGVSACGIIGIADEDTGQDTSQFDKFLINWTLPYPTADWSGAVFEMKWDSTQAFGRGLALRWELDGCVNAEEREGSFVDVAGVSPIRVFLTKEQLQEVVNLEDDTCTDGFTGEEVAKNCGPESCNLISRVFSDTATMGPSSEADVGLTLQQSFSQYLTVFYGDLPPGAEEYSALV